MNYQRETTPNLDELADQGVCFEQAVAQGPLTRPSFQSILTSTYPLMYGGYEKLNEERTIVSEPLQNEGLKTAAFHSNPWLSSLFGYDRGFDTFEDSLASGQTKKYKAAFEEELKETSERLHSFMKKIFSLKHKISEKLNPGNDRHYVPADEITKKAMKWIEKNQKENFFVWLHYMDPHHPHLPIEDCREFYKQPLEKEKILNIQRKNREPNELTEDEIKLMIDLYDGEIRYVDVWINTLLEKLKKLGISENTLKIVTADHGKPFLNRENSKFTTRLYDENIHVPLIIEAGENFESKTFEEQVELLDIPPTILNYLNLEIPENFQGESLNEVLKGTTKGQKHAFSEVVEGAEKNDKLVKGDIHRACRTKNWKCVLNEKKKEAQLYNLERDPNETTDCSKENKDKFEELLVKIKKHSEREESTTETSEKERIKRRVKNSNI